MSRSIKVQLLTPFSLLFEHRIMVIKVQNYCSNLNPIERFWRYLKDQAFTNHLKNDILCVLKQAEKPWYLS